MAVAEKEEGSLVRSLKDLFAGAVGGVAQVLIGKAHIPETVKITIELAVNTHIFYKVNRSVLDP